MAVQDILNQQNPVVLEVSDARQEFAEIFKREIEEPVVLEWVQALVDKLVLEARKEEPRIDANKIQVVLTDGATTTAAIVPNYQSTSYLFVDKQLFQLAESEDEIAFILGHEIGHLVFRCQHNLSYEDKCYKIEETTADLYGLKFSTGAGYASEGSHLAFRHLIEHYSHARKRDLISSLMDPHCSPHMRYEQMKNDVQGFSRTATGKGIEGEREYSLPIPKEIRERIGKIELDKSYLSEFLAANNFISLPPVQKLSLLIEAIDYLDSDSLSDFTSAFLSIRINRSNLDSNLEVKTKLDEIVDTLLDDYVDPELLNQEYQKTAKTALAQIFPHAFKLWRKTQDDIGKTSWFAFPPIGIFVQLDDAFKSFVEASSFEERVTAAKKYNELEPIERLYGEIVQKNYFHHLADDYKELENLRSRDEKARRQYEIAYDEWDNLTSEEKKEIPKPRPPYPISSNTTDDKMLGMWRRNSPFASINRENIRENPYVKEAAADLTGEIAIALFKRVFSCEGLRHSNPKGTLADLFLDSLPIEVHQLVTNHSLTYSPDGSYLTRGLEDRKKSTRRIPVKISEMLENTNKIVGRYLQWEQFPPSKEQGGSYWSLYSRKSESECWKIHIKEAIRITKDLESKLRELEFYEGVIFLRDKIYPLMMALSYDFHTNVSDKISHPYTQFVLKHVKSIPSKPKRINLLIKYLLPTLEELEDLCGVKFPRDFRQLQKFLDEDKFPPYDLQAFIRILKDQNPSSTHERWKLLDELFNLPGLSTYINGSDSPEKTDELRRIFLDKNNETALKEPNSIELRYKSLISFEKLSLFTDYNSRKNYWNICFNEINELSPFNRIFYYERMLRDFKTFPSPQITAKVSEYWAQSIKDLEGIDDESEEFSEKTLSYLSTIGRDISPDMMQRLGEALSNSLITQEKLTFSTQDLIEQHRRTNKDLNGMKGNVLLSAIEYAAEYTDAAHDMIDFFRSPLSPESVDWIHDRSQAWVDSSFLFYKLAGEASNDQRVLARKMGFCNLHELFWSQGITERSYIIKSMLIDPIRMYEDPEVTRADAKEFALSRLFPKDNDPTSKEAGFLNAAKLILSTHIDTMHESQRSLVIGAMLASSMNTQENNEFDMTELGRRVAEICASLGTAYHKIAQAFESYPDADPDFIAGFKGVKSGMNFPTRAQFFKRRNELVPQENLADIAWYGEITNAASAYMIMQCRTKSGEVEALRLARKWAKELSSSGFKDCRSTTDTVCSLEPSYERYARHVERLLGRAEVHTHNELTEAHRQYQIALNTYPSGVIGKINGYEIEVNVVPWKLWGEEWQRIEWAYGDSFKDLPSYKVSQKTEDDINILQASATGLFFLTASAIASGRKVDTDRHEDQTKILVDRENKVISLYLLDHGGMQLEDPNKEELESLGRRVKNAFSRDIKESEAVERLINEIIDIETEDNDYLCDVRKTMLSISFVHEYLNTKALKEMFGRLALRGELNESFKVLMPWWINFGANIVSRYRGV